MVTVICPTCQSQVPQEAKKQRRRPCPFCGLDLAMADSVKDLQPHKAPLLPTEGRRVIRSTKPLGG